MEAASDSHCQRWVVNENLRRCLTIEAPLPEDKLQMLSEIAQVGGRGGGASVFASTVWC